MAHPCAVLSDDQLAIKVEPDVQNEREPCAAAKLPFSRISADAPPARSPARARADTLNLLVTYTPTYPDEPPELDIDVLEGEVSDEEKEVLLAGLGESANESLGMVRPPFLSCGRDGLTCAGCRQWCTRWRSS